MKYTFPLTSLTLITLLLSACGTSSNSHPRQDFLDRAPVQGDLTPLIQKFHASEYLTSCDQQHLPQMLEIANELDQRSGELEAYSKGLPPSKDYRRVLVGPIVVRERLHPRAPKTEWLSDHTSWQEIIEDYQNAKKDSDPRKWYAVNAEVRNILTDDQYRLNSGEEYAISHGDEPLLKGIHDLTTLCLANINCTHPDFTLDALTWFNKQRYYSALFTKIKQANIHSESEPLLKELRNAIQIDLSEFQIRKNTSITRKGPELTLPLYPGIFSDVTEALANYSEPIWSSRNLKLKITWASRPDDSIFSLILGEHAGGRSYVSFKKQEVHLESDVRAKSIAHEIGHTLGFKDHYYTTWNGTECKYTTEYREDDLMSDAEFASVTDDEWQTLDSTYP